MASSARIDELKKKFDENPRRYFAPLANEYRKAGDLEQAIFICQEYLPQQPGHMSGHIVYGQALYELGRYDEAKAVFETALGLDPENLIALRHLGDIAHSSGDVSTARAWYQRVLEADPRNEEIAQLVSSIQVPPTSAAAPVRQTPLASPVIPPVPQTPGWPSATVPSEVETRTPAAGSAAFDVEKSEEDTGIGAPALHSLDDADVERNEPDESASVAQTADAGDDLLDLDDFSIGGIASSPEPVSEPPAPQPPTLLELASSDDEDGGFNLGEEEGPFEADPFAIAAAPTPEPSIELGRPSTEPPIELATDLELGLPDDGRSEPAPNSADAETLTGLETFESGIQPPAEGVMVLETASFYEIPELPRADAEQIASDRDAGTRVPEQTIEDAVPPATAFVTETMAELYLEQGHFEEALDIYLQLVEQRPEDERLAERTRALEHRLYGTPAHAAEAAEPESPMTAEPVASPKVVGPTIREFLSGLMSRRAAASPAADDSPPASTPDADVLPDAAPDAPPEEEYGTGMAADTNAPSDLEARATPAANGQTVTGSIDALFSGAGASSSDSSAANTLAEAFAPDDAPTTPLEGVPAHRAASELSLDHVFKANSPPRTDADGEAFSFDQFFAEDVGGTSPTSSASATPDATDDIAQFNAWLNGLKKS